MRSDTAGGAVGELVMYDPDHPEKAAGKWVFYNGTPRGKVYFPLGGCSDISF